MDLGLHFFGPPEPPEMELVRVGLEISPVYCCDGGAADVGPRWSDLDLKELQRRQKPTAGHEAESTKAILQKANTHLLLEPHMFASPVF